MSDFVASRILAGAIRTAAHCVAPLPAAFSGGGHVFRIGDGRVLDARLPSWTRTEREEILESLGLLHATARMREREIRGYLANTGTFLDQWENNVVVRGLPEGSRAACLRMVLAQCLGTLAMFFPETDADSLPWSSPEILGRVTISACVNPTAVYALECLSRGIKSRHLFATCSGMLLSPFPGGAAIPFEQQMAVAGMLCHSLLRAASDLLLVLLGGSGIKSREITKARHRITATLGICFADATTEEITSRGESAGPAAPYGFEDFLQTFAAKLQDDAEALAAA